MGNYYIVTYLYIFVYELAASLDISISFYAIIELGNLSWNKQ